MAIRSIETEVIFHGRSRNECWFEPTAALVPPGRNGTDAQVIVTATQQTGNDIGPHHFTWTRNLGRHWSNPAESQALQQVPLDNHVFEKHWLAPFYHRASDTLLMLGRTCFTQDQLPSSSIKGEMHAVWAPGCRGVDLRYSFIYSYWAPDRQNFVPWQRLDTSDFFEADEILSTSDVCQRVEESDGTILTPVTRSVAGGKAGVGVLRVAWDGTTLRIVQKGSLLQCEDVRGLHEPSLVRFGGRYLLTIRNDLRGYVAASEDGLMFTDMQPWCFDDGAELGNYNTQQHWLVLGDRLHLVYNRRSELNNGVVRSRAPLFIAEVDPDALRVLRDTERVVLPEKGARMGNFCTLNVTPSEAWVITGEWLQQLVPGYTPDMPFYADAAGGASPYNRIQYIGDLLLARIRWG